MKLVRVLAEMKAHNKRRSPATIPCIPWHMIALWLALASVSGAAPTCGAGYVTFANTSCTDGTVVALVNTSTAADC